MPQSVTQYRRTVGDHVNWSDKQQGNQEKQNKRIRQLATQPGCHTGNRDRQQVAYAAIQLLSVLSSVQNIEPNPAITVRRADALRAKEKVAHADKLCLGKMVEQGVSREAIRHADTNFRAENSLKTQGGLCKQPGVFVPREDKSLPDQIQPPDNSLSTPHSASERAIPPSACENAVHVANGENIFSAILDPLANALYETGQFISQFDPLKFPIAAASALPLSSVSDKKNMYEIQDDSVNQALFCALTDRCILNLSGNNSAVPVILFFPRSQSNTREKRASIERSQQLENIAYQKYLADNCHIRTKTNQGVVVGDNILATGEMVRNPIRAAAEKLYRYGMGGHEMPEWLVRFTEGVNMGCDIVLGMMSMGAWPIIKYSSAKALSVSGHAINGDITCLKNEFSAEELARLLFDTEVGITDRYAFHSFPVRPTRPIHPNPSELKNVRPFVPDGLFVHENAANNLNTVKYMTINHQGKEYIIREKLPREYWAFHPHAVKPDLIEKKIYFDAINNKIHFNSDIPDGQGLDYNIIEGKKFIQLNDENHEITWNWSNNNLEVALYKKNGETLNVPVYMEPLSKKWHLSTHNTHPAFRRKQEKIIERIRITKNDNYNYFTEKK